MEKLYQKHEAYPNVEVDIIFRGNRIFDVTHDDNTSFNLNLDSYFAYMNDKEGRIWLDVKNLTSDNQASMLMALNRLTRHYQMEKDRLIIESPYPEFLVDFTREGYYTSYYVTYREPCSLDRKEMDDCIAELRRVADGGGVSALSFPGYWYETIKERLDRPIDLLTWEHRKNQLEFLLSSSGRRMLCDPQLKVILVKDKGKYHR